jgi:hypothetical protein
MMPSTSKKQHNFMEAVAHSPAFAKKAGVPQSVGKDFSNADKGRKFSKGGDMKAMKKMAGGGSAMSGKMGAVKTAAPSKDGVASKGKTKGTMIKMGGSKGQNGLPTKMSRGGMAC